MSFSELDAKDPLAHLRHQFHIPSRSDVGGAGDEPCIYLCGNSLGLLPRTTPELISQELKVWADKGVHGHFDHPHKRPWVSVDDLVLEQSARLVGALKEEIAIMNSLTVNLHFLMISFYRPTPSRFKIIMESRAFPSDYYAVESQVKLHGYAPEDAIIEVKPREGEHTLRMTDILDVIAQHGQDVALIMFSGVQYYTGQFFDLPAIVKAGREQGCKIGFDLAHAAGNVPLKLHDWDVDFACWYVNAGPGGIGGAFVHAKYAKDQTLMRLTGWWGSDPSVKFQMDNVWRPLQNTQVYRVSNPNVLAVTSLYGSLQVFAQTSMTEMRQKSELLTGYLESLLKPLPHFVIITPERVSERGCQLSLLFDDGYMEKVFRALEKAGIVVDERKPNVIRVAPTPLYNTFADVYGFYLVLKQIVKME